MIDQQTKTLLYNACCNNDYDTFRGNLIVSSIDGALDDQGNTALHIATRDGQQDIVRLLLRYHAIRTVLNNEGKSAIQMTSNDPIVKLYQSAYRPLADVKTENPYVSKELEVEPIEWLDSYRNAYRISYENHEHMKRWITKIPLKKLLEELRDNYIDKLVFPTPETRTNIKTRIQDAIEKNNPMQLAKVYTGASGFCTRLNTDLAKLGSDFRFISTRLDYPDNEPPKDLGQYIYASLLINHTIFRSYRHASKTFRGMTITPEDLAVYAPNKIVITRSFLSTSKQRHVAEFFLGLTDIDKSPPVVCIYNVINPRSSLCIELLSHFPEEEEVLIVPFIAFEITSVKEIKMEYGTKSYSMKEIELVECGPNPR